MNYAVVDICGHQYFVYPQAQITVDRLTYLTDSHQVSKQVLLVVDDNKVTIGKPYIDKIQVTYKVIKHIKGQKIDVSTYKAKSRYRKKIGFRPSQTIISVESIETIKKTK